MARIFLNSKVSFLVKSFPKYISLLILYFPSLEGTKRRGVAIEMDAQGNIFPTKSDIELNSPTSTKRLGLFVPVSGIRIIKTVFLFSVASIDVFVNLS